MVYLYMACAEHHMVASTDWVQGKFTGKPESPIFHEKVDGKSMVSGFDFPLNPSIDSYYCEGQFAES